MNPNHVYKLKKALYGLKQAPRAWYDRLSTFLLNNDFEKGKVDTTLFIKRDESDFILVQIYVDDIIFGSTNSRMVEDFSLTMSREFEMSMMGELGFFLGFEIKQLTSGTFVNQTKYTLDIIKKFGLDCCKSMSTPMSPNTQLDKDRSCQNIRGKSFYF